MNRFMIGMGKSLGHNVWSRSATIFTVENLFFSLTNSFHTQFWLVILKVKTLGPMFVCAYNAE